MKRPKVGIKTRVFLGFGLFVIIIINLFIFGLYNLIGSSYLKNTEKNIDRVSQELIEEIIKNNKKTENYILNINPELTKSIEDTGIFFYIFLKNENSSSKYKLGTYIYEDKVISRSDFKNYKIIVGKDIGELNDFKRSIIDQIIFINAFTIFLVFAMSYFMADRVLKPLLKLSKELSDYDIQKDKHLIKNNFGESEIGIITDATNKFIQNSKHILENQKQFIQDSSHELKTPLMQIDSNLDIIEEKITDEKIRKKLQHIRSSTANINTIVSNLSFIMRGEERITQKEKIAIQSYLSNLIKNFYSLANEKNIQLEIENKQDFILENSPYYLDRLFGNLLQNSIFYNEGNNKIKFVIEEKKVTLIDEGIGIGQEEQEKIFSRFYRNTHSSNYNQNGSGLGLTIVQKICDDFGWKLEVYSEKGKGSRFVVNF